MNTPDIGTGEARSDRPFISDDEWFRLRPRRFFRVRRWRVEDVEDYADYHGGPGMEDAWFAVAFRDGDYVSQRFCPPEDKAEIWLYRIRVASWALGCARAWLENYVFRGDLESRLQ